MTETREVPQVSYRKLAAKAYKMSMLMSAEMDKIRPGGASASPGDDWAELHDISKIISAAFCQLCRLRDRQAAAAEVDAPVPYALADALTAGLPVPLIGTHPDDEPYQPIDRGMRAFNTDHADYYRPGAGT